MGDESVSENAEGSVVENVAGDAGGNVDDTADEYNCNGNIYCRGKKK